MIPTYRTPETQPLLFTASVGQGDPSSCLTTRCRLSRSGRRQNCSRRCSLKKGGDDPKVPWCGHVLLHPRCSCCLLMSSPVPSRRAITACHHGVPSHPPARSGCAGLGASAALLLD